MSIARGVFICAIIAYCSFVAAQEPTKYALAIGNSEYANYVDLKNPVNDVSAVSKKLKELGFKVSTLKNVGQVEIENELVSFSNELKSDPNSIGVFYYAGHAVQSGGKNYLIPVDANIPSESFLKSKAVSLQLVLDVLGESRNKTNILILDACRNNPFAWSRDLTRGLAVVQSQPAGSIVIYSTNENNVALDGEGDNSVFAKALVDHLGDASNLDSIINSTALAVIKSTGGAQTPAVYKQTFEEIYLSGRRPAAEQAAPAEAEPAVAVAAAPRIVKEKVVADGKPRNLEVSLHYSPFISPVAQYMGSEATIIPAAAAFRWNAGKSLYVGMQCFYAGVFFPGDEPLQLVSGSAGAGLRWSAKKTELFTDLHIGIVRGDNRGDFNVTLAVLRPSVGLSYLLLPNLKSVVTLEGYALTEFSHFAAIPNLSLGIAYDF